MYFMPYVLRDYLSSLRRVFARLVTMHRLLMRKQEQNRTNVEKNDEWVNDKYEKARDYDNDEAVKAL